MPTEEQLSKAKDHLLRAEQLAGVAAQEISKLRASGRHQLAEQMQKELDEKRRGIAELRRVYGI